MASVRNVCFAFAVKSNRPFDVNVWNFVLICHIAIKR
jgi:hypothetical protein